MRGALRLGPVVGGVCRLTPAGAGSTTSPPPTDEPTGAYPRRCGEHGVAGGQAVLDRGLPPQVRGARCRTACRTGTSRAYPRRCGEHTITGNGISWKRGLPPQVRGARSGVQPDRLEGGLTPAGAGSTALDGRRDGPRPAYPRRCGEHHPRRRQLRTVQGLPPQVRGAREYALVVGWLVGLTPAGAGSTKACVTITDRNPGLPPQVRGAPGSFPKGSWTSRLTPAGAGSTS